jgi:hypothetical protein
MNVTFEARLSGGGVSIERVSIAVRMRKAFHRTFSWMPQQTEQDNANTENSCLSTMSRRRFEAGLTRYNTGPVTVVATRYRLGTLYVPRNGVDALIYDYEEPSGLQCSLCVKGSAGSFPFAGDIRARQSTILPLNWRQRRVVLFAELQPQSKLAQPQLSKQKPSNGDTAEPPWRLTEVAKNRGKKKLLEEREKRLLACFRS